jgi:hypothetical protein
MRATIDQLRTTLAEIPPEGRREALEFSLGFATMGLKFAAIAAMTDTMKEIAMIAIRAFVFISSFFVFVAMTPYLPAIAVSIVGVSLAGMLVWEVFLLLFVHPRDGNQRLLQS